MKIHVNKRRWYLALINCALLLLVLILALVFFHVAGTLDSIRAADRWRGENDMRFAQLACFLPVDAPKTESDIMMFRQTLEQKLLDASLEAESSQPNSAPNNAQETQEANTLYADAYSGTASMTVAGDHGSAQVKAIGVGGNFFLFHPLQLRSGSYISDSDFMQDRVVLDEVLAWQLFGGYDVAGMTVTINQKPYYVAGVVRRESDFATSDAYLDGAGMFISYSAFQEVTGTDAITCYEIVMPDMITGFAKGIVSENFSVGNGDIVENSSRYSLGNLWEVVKSFGLRSMRNNGVIYPYWENAVRLTEDYLALLLVLMVLFALCPAITGLVFLIRTVIRLYRLGKRRIPDKIGALVEKKKEAKYAKMGE